MNAPNSYGASHIEGFEAPMHRALAEPILLGGAPRAIAIVVVPTPVHTFMIGMSTWLATAA